MQLPGLCNGTLVWVRDFVWAEGKDPHKGDLPLIIYVEPLDPFYVPTPFYPADQADRPEAERSRWIPITPHYETWTDSGGAKCSRTQFHLMLAWAITVHKSQGLGFDSARVEVSGDRDFSSSLTYVALSRLKRLEGLYLERAVTMQRLLTCACCTCSYHYITCVYCTCHEAKRLSDDLYD